eukprot:m.623449 g.623449  ORF g.623449 m.623449 type:complete len:84 (-) comp58222_c0_seq85:235-486(-)
MRSSTTRAAWSVLWPQSLVRSVDMLLLLLLVSSVSLHCCRDVSSSSASRHVAAYLVSFLIVVFLARPAGCRASDDLRQWQCAS